MRKVTIEQLKAVLKSLSQSVFKHVERAQETADKAQKTADGKMDAVNPTATGYFAMNFSGNFVPGDCSFTEGRICRAIGRYSHAEGQGTEATGIEAHAEGGGTVASGFRSHAEGSQTIAQGGSSHAEGIKTEAQRSCSHAEGSNTIAKYEFQHVQGKWNDPGPAKSGSVAEGLYAHIVGNGTGEIINGVNMRSNAHTLDWDGNAWYAGTIEGTALILKSSGDKRFKITVSDSGALTATEIT